MFRAHSTATSSSNFQQNFSNALKAYEKRTKQDLLTHPLAAQLQACDTPYSILLVLRQQVQHLDQSRTGDDRLTKWLDPTVNIIYTLSATVGECVGVVFSPPNVIFTGVGILLSVAKDVRAGQDDLINIFERVETFFRRLELYTEVPPTREMVDTITTIMIQVVRILAIATKEIEQGRTKKYRKKLVGRTDVEDALKRLDNLTQEEPRMAAAEVLRVRQQSQSAIDVDHVKRPDPCRWLSPPDPSTNHNIACGAYLKRAATWFLQGSMYNEWKLTGSLLWIDGKPGSGKTILCSTIIQDIRVMCDAGQASMAYFYFDFRDTGKQHWRDVVPSLLTQLSALSDPRCDILSRFYFDYDNGARQPSDDALTSCLREMLALPDQRPVYLVMDALDECPNISGVSSPRDQVLRPVKELIDLCLPNLHICVTSRPEVDIRDALEPLTSYQLSLHDQIGQNNDIVDYIRSFVYSDSEPTIRGWKEEDKEFAVEMLSKQADGIFQRVFCQLATLRDCVPSSVRHTLRELPESLDEIYERILKEIKKPNRDDARRVLECLVVAIRPLRVAELAQVLIIDFDDVEGIPKLNTDRRRENPELALLITFSSLIAVVEAGDSRIVQLSHLSVKEFLTSSRLAAASGEVSDYYVNLKFANTTLAQACLSIFMDDLIEHSGVEKRSPLVGYATENWVRHAQFEDVASGIKRLGCLFDLDKPFFAAWCRLRDIDTHPSHNSVFYEFTPTSKSGANTPLYYAALCGFTNIVEQLIVKHSQYADTIGGYYMTPAVAALAGRHFQLAEVLHLKGSSLNPRGYRGKSPLHSAAYYGDVEMVQVLLDYGVDVDARCDFGSTPLHFTSYKDRTSSPFASWTGQLEVVRILIEHRADVMAKTKDGDTPLHLASLEGKAEVLRELFECRPSLSIGNKDGNTPLHLAAREGKAEVVRMLLERGAFEVARNLARNTPLHLASRGGKAEVVRILIECTVSVIREPWNKDRETPLHLASREGNPEVVRMLIKDRADVTSLDRDGWNPLHLALSGGRVELVHIYIEHLAIKIAQGEYKWIPSHRSPFREYIDVAQILFNDDTDTIARDRRRLTPLHLVSGGHVKLALILLEHSADATTAQDWLGWTPLGPSSRKHVELAHTLLERGVDADARDNDNCTPSHWASQQGHLEVVRVLVEHGVDADARDNDNCTPLHCASQQGHAEVVRVLVKQGIDVNAQDHSNWTPLHGASQNGHLEVVQFLLEHGANAHASDQGGWTPLQWPSYNGDAEIVRALLEHGADANSQDNNNWTPLHSASQLGHLEVVQVLLEHGANANLRDSSNETPMLLASRARHRGVVQLLIENLADINTRNKFRTTRTALHSRKRW